MAIILPSCSCRSMKLKKTLHNNTFKVNSCYTFQQHQKLAQQDLRAIINLMTVAHKGSDILAFIIELQSMRHSCLHYTIAKYLTNSCLQYTIWRQEWCLHHTFIKPVKMQVCESIVSRLDVSVHLLFAAFVKARTHIWKQWIDSQPRGEERRGEERGCPHRLQTFWSNRASSGQVGNTIMP